MSSGARHANANRFVVLLHQPGIESKRDAQSHYDWMFEVDGQLLTWATAPLKPGIESIQVNEPIVTGCEPLAPHRLAYLEYEGEVSGGRGRVTRLLAGRYTLNDFDDDLFDAELRWTQSMRAGSDESGPPGTLAAQARTARLSIYRRFFPDADGRLAESRESWLLRFSLCR